MFDDLIPLEGGKRNYFLMENIAHDMAIFCKSGVYMDRRVFGIFFGSSREQSKLRFLCNARI